MVSENFVGELIWLLQGHGLLSVYEFLNPCGRAGFVRIMRKNILKNLSSETFWIRDIKE
jgi:hypothetical protein